MYAVTEKITQSTASIITMAFPKLSLHCICRNPVSIQMGWKPNGGEFSYLLACKNITAWPKKFVNSLLLLLTDAVT